MGAAVPRNLSLSEYPLPHRAHILRKAFGCGCDGFPDGVASPIHRPNSCGPSRLTFALGTFRAGARLHRRKLRVEKAPQPRLWKDSRCWPWDARDRSPCIPICEISLVSVLERSSSRSSFRYLRRSVLPTFRGSQGSQKNPDRQPNPDETLAKSWPSNRNRESIGDPPGNPAENRSSPALQSEIDRRARVGESLGDLVFL